MPNYKIKAYIGVVPNGGCVPVFTIASPDQEDENIYDTLKEAKESLLAQIKASGRLGWEQRLESAYIKKLTLKKLFAEHFAYVDYLMGFAELGGIHDEYDDDEADWTKEIYTNCKGDEKLGIDYPEASEIVKA